MPQPYERFDAWQHCHRLVLEVYRVTAGWPKGEQFGLTAQVRRATISATLNVVEGSAKRGSKEFRRYLDIANGSLAEVGYCVRLASDLDYLPSDRSAALEKVRERAARAVWGLYRALGEHREP
jgi:four helix bundle protein